MWELQYAQRVVHEDIPALDSAIKQRIRKAIESKLATDPMRFGKPLRYSFNHLRSLRVGDWRVLYSVDPEKQRVCIVSIGHRRDVYEE